MLAVAFAALGLKRKGKKGPATWVKGASSPACNLEKYPRKFSGTIGSGAQRTNQSQMKKSGQQAKPILLSCHSPDLARRQEPASKWGRDRRDEPSLFLETKVPQKAAWPGRTFRILDERFATLFSTTDLAMAAILELIIALITASLTFLLLWRRYQSPLSDIPGPFLASFTRLWHIIRIFAGDINVRSIREHEKHGMLQ
jgi:hypothetical protein